MIAKKLFSFLKKSMKNILNLKSVKCIKPLLVASVVAVSSNTVFGEPLFSKDILDKVNQESQHILKVYDEHNVPLIFSEDYRKSLKELLESVKENALSKQLHYLNSTIDDFQKFCNKNNFTNKEIGYFCWDISNKLNKLHKLMLQANGEHEDAHEE